MSPQAGPYEISEAQPPRRRDGIASVEIDGEGVLYDPETHGLHVLNPTALLVWDRLEGTTSIAEIVAEFADASGTDPDIVHEGVIELVRDLMGRGLLEDPSAIATDGRGSR